MQHQDVIIAGWRGVGLSDTAAQALAAASEPVRLLKAEERLIDAGQPSHSLHILLTGLAKSYANLPNGAAQTLALMAPGDIMDAAAYAKGEARTSICAVSACRIACVPRSRLEPLLAQQPEIARALWRATARETAVLQEWMVGMGRRTAQSQLAHLLCELVWRLPSTGGEGERGCELPLTQAEIADIMGLSAVHVNRVLQHLRADGLIQLNHGRLSVLDWEKLVATADFDPSYLAHAARPVSLTA